MNCSSDPARTAFNEQESHWDGEAKRQGTEFPIRGVNHARNHINRDLDPGALGSIAAVVAQSRVGLCSVGWRRPRDPHRCHSCTSWAYLGMSQVVGGE